jgi:hypothetical protein
MRAQHGPARRLTGVTAAVLGIVLSGGPVVAPAAASAPTVAALPAAAAQTAGVTVRIDPSYQRPEFEGWGTSLVWFANKTGGYPAAVRKKLADMLFGDDGLRLNIARYNIGGGNAPTVTDYMRPGGAVPGWWKADKPYTPNDKQWWDPQNPDHWNWDADPNQRWWIDQIKGKVTRWEAFSNSPPWFQTESGWTSGGFDSSTEQIRADKVDDFAEYLVRVTEQLEKKHKIKIGTIDPLNEPNTNYWGTPLGPDGLPLQGTNPANGKKRLYQEGAHAGPALQAKVILALKKRLATAKTKAAISAPDETNPERFLDDWYGYPAEAQAAVTQLNVHTYGTGRRTSVRDVAKAESRKLWMSEVEGSWGTTFDGMDSGLGMASLIVNDFRELEPSAWVLWQPVEDVDNMVDEGNLQWGSIHLPFNCKSTDTLATCPIKTNTKFDTLRNFTHYIRPGDRIVNVDNTSSMAAVTKTGQNAVVVHVNPDATARRVTLDLSRFGTISSKATVTPVVTSAAGKLVRGKPVKVSNRAATLTVPAQSVTTFLISGVSGVSKDAALVQPGHVFRLQGVESGRSLAPTEDGAGALLRTTDVARAEQLWYVSKQRPVAGREDRYLVVNAANGRRLAVRDGAVVLEGTTAADTAAEWVMSTTGDGSYTFVNVGAKAVIDVPGHATADGTRVSTYRPSSGPNQRWTVLDETVVSPVEIAVYTVPRKAPVLPKTVTARLSSGASRVLPVTWTMPSASTWRKPGKFSVPGVATDVLGRRVKVQAQVTVDIFTSTVPARAKTYVAGRPVLPTTVTGVGMHGGRAKLPVTWNPARPGAFDKAGVVTLTGRAQVVDGAKLRSTVRVQVTQPTEVNAGVENGVSVSATSAENGYWPEGLRNGVTKEKAWSTWKSGTQNPSDAVTFALPRQLDVTRVVTHFYRDSAGGAGIAQSLKVQVRGADGTCVDASGEVPVTIDTTPGAPVPVVDIPVTAGPTNGVCVAFTPQPNGYLTVGEIQIFAKAAGSSSTATLSSIEVNGVPVKGFDPARKDYRVVLPRGTRAVVTATPADPFAVVDISTAPAAPNVRVITVVSEDRTVTRRYEVRIVN